MTLQQEDREGMITTLSVMTGKPESYFEDMADVRLISEYDRLLKIL